jgi:hypothetical protein
MQSNKPPAELSADLVDVHILEMLVHIEALLRSARVIQRHVLVLRGVRALKNEDDDSDAAEQVRQRLMQMSRECEAAQSAIQGTMIPAATLSMLPPR